jgi:5'-nucleotidase
MIHSRSWPFILMLLAACGGSDPSERDAGSSRRDGAVRDGGTGADSQPRMDASSFPDAAGADAASRDGGASDSGGIDAAADAMAGDALPGDGASPDAAGDAGARDAGGRVEIQLISISDWHGQLDPLAPTTGTISVGGAAVLSAYFAEARAANPNTVVVTAGDAFGGTPPLAGFFEEEPAVRALNLMGLDVDTFGNHNFDRGLMHLQRMIDLADYTFVSSNLGNLAGSLMGVVEPYELIDVGGVRVAFIGITNDDAVSLTFPGRFGTVTVQPSAAAATAARMAAANAGAEVFVALVHMGANVGTSTATPEGPIVDFARAVSGFDVIFGDHTDVELNTVINGQRVVENRSKGRTFARVRLAVDRGMVQVLSSEIVSPLVNRVTPDARIESMLAPYRAQLQARLDAPLGTANGLFPRGGGLERSREAAIGNLVTDAMRLRYGTQVAFTNGGGLRDALPSAYRPADTMLRRNAMGYAMGPPYDLVVGDAYGVLPFGNAVVTRTVTGEQIWDSLEHAVSAMPAANGRFAQISGFRFTYTASAAPGTRVLSVELDSGVPIPRSRTATYSAAVMDFINAGGDGYVALADGMGSTREIAADVLASHIMLSGTITPTISGRITRVFCGAPRAPAPGDLVVNEIHADPAEIGGDANGDGVRDGADDEFVEIVNLSGDILDLSGVVLSDALSVRHTFAGRLQCRSAIVVFGGGSPMHPAWRSSWVVASNRALNLNNTGDTISLGSSAASPTDLATVTYGGVAGNDESIVREFELDASSAFIRHSAHANAGGRRFSPGTRVDGTRF